MDVLSGVPGLAATRADHGLGVGDLRDRSKEPQAFGNVLFKGNCLVLYIYSRRMCLS